MSNRTRTQSLPSPSNLSTTTGRSQTLNESHLCRSPCSCASFRGLSSSTKPHLRDCLPHHPPNTLHPEKHRNLVICIDGTSNQFGGMNTNIIELYHSLAKDENQLTYYESGTGAYADPSQKSLSYWKQNFKNRVNLAFAWNLERIIIDVYGWLVETFREGDVVYLFGFSRGAYQIRALSAMIEKVGLVHKGNTAQIPFAYKFYADPHSGDLIQGELGHLSSRADRFKETFSRSIRVHFVGAWDTVSSVGIVRNKTLPMTADGMTHVCHFRHALALDERRVKFLPEYAYGGVTKKLKNRNIPSKREKQDEKTTNEGSGNPGSISEGDVKEVWFAGTHSDIGGGNTANKYSDRSGPPLSWMLSEAISCGLRVNAKSETSKRWKWGGNEEPYESLSGVWKLFEYMPVKRLTYRGQHTTTRRPHTGKGRKILPGQLIHGSLTLEENYTPKASALGPDGRRLEWATMIEDRNDWLEKDLLGAALILADDIRDSMEQDSKGGELHTTDLDKLIEFINSPSGRWTIGKAPGIASPIEKIIIQISGSDGLQAIRDQLVKVFIDAGGRVSSSELFNLVFPTAPNKQLVQRTKAPNVQGIFAPKPVLPWSDPSGSGHSLAGSDMSATEPTTTDNESTENLSDTGDPPFVHMASPVHSIAFTPDGKYIASGSNDNNVRIWDAATGHCVKQLLGHTYPVYSVAVSPDGKLVVSGSADKTIQIWDLETGASVGEPWNGHTGDIDIVAFSPDGKHIVTGSDDNTIQVWDTTTRRCINELSGHSDWVQSVAVSPDGELIASGSWDHTIRIWDLKTGTSVGKPWEEKGGYFFSVAFSPDGKHVVSASSDITVQIWDVATGDCIKRLSGHTNWVYSVAVSPDGKLIASGSVDKTIRIWDLETGASIGEPLTGHTDWVRSVVFSPDGQYIVSCSDDYTIRRWQLSALGIDTANFDS